MKGEKSLIQIINKFDNFYSNETVLKVETAQAQLSEELSPQKKIPSFKARPTKKSMFELVCGSIHTKHGIALQEKSEHSTLVRSVNSITLFGKKEKKLLRLRHVIYQQ